MTMTSMTTRNRRLTIAIAILLALSTLTAAAAQPRQAANAPSVSDQAGVIRFRPQPAGVQVGGTITVEVWLEGVSGYYGMDMKLSFDTSRLQAVSTKVTPLWDVFDEDNHFTIRNQVDNATGLVWYAVTNINPAEPFAGAGRICSITFTGVAEGTAVLEFTDTKGSTKDGDALWPTQVDGTVVVGQDVYRIHLPVVAVQ